MKRLTEKNPSWIDNEFWMSAEEPSEEVVDEVYLRLRDYEDIGTVEEFAELKQAKSDVRLVGRAAKEERE